MNDPKYGLMLTGGSWSVNWTFDSLSRAGAGARMLLTEAAAKQMNVAVADCVAEDGRIRHLPTGRSMPYGEIVAKVPITRTLSEEDLKKIELKKPSQYRIIGKWIPRLDIPEKVTGKAKFGIDTFLPGMVYAKVAYPPTREGGKHTAVDDTGARKVKGWIQTVVTDDVVAVVADTYDNAVRARDALRVSWDPGPNAGVSTASIFEMYAKKAKEDLTAPSWVEQGDVKAGLAQAAKTHEATFTTDYVAHMQMEPMNCVVRLDGGAYDIYTGSQFQTMAVGALSKKLGVDPSKIRIHQHYLGRRQGDRLGEHAGGGVSRRTLWRARRQGTRSVRAQRQRPRVRDPEPVRARRPGRDGNVGRLRAGRRAQLHVLRRRDIHRRAGPPGQGRPGAVPPGDAGRCTAAGPCA